VWAKDSTRGTTLEELRKTFSGFNDTCFLCEGTDCRPTKNINSFDD